VLVQNRLLSPNVQIAKAANNPFSDTLTSPWHRPKWSRSNTAPVDAVSRNVATDAVPNYPRVTPQYL
jgi:hypothetical protein